ncbi:MAG: bifunctional demethylmenaquinone methyltransferase/2-methoxy-6-polyprenyl-1,4-benzoquinol methylase UbiE [Nitrospirota bacterium]|nr:bifunctional demethylmenaquinone methyltransferase/2-methoxy-6-polyprenyl-1,4-benzoquinol methylase UbiE [Nitrospirota bacterium]
MTQTAFDKEKTVQKMFSSIAHYYDLNNSLLSLGLHHSWKKKTLDLLDISPEHKVLDIGSGTADLSILAAERLGEGGFVIASDLNEPMLSIGKKKIESRALKHVSVALANAEHLPFRDESFDAILTGFCMRNVSNLDQALSEIYRLLKPGGKMACLDFSTPVFRPFRKIYDFYSFSLLPKIGTWVSRDKTGIYQYLPDSIRKFPNQKTFRKQITNIGFQNANYQNLAGGIVAIHTGTR